MKLIEFYSKLKYISMPFFKTHDVAVLCNLTNIHASQLLTRLSKNNQVMSIKKGVLALPESISPYELPYYLTTPLPSYISLQSALYHHGMISQIPDIIYAVSLSRTRTYHTLISTVSIHRIIPELFFGYTELSPYILMASPEKSLVDFFYYSQTRSRLFYKLPKLELPKSLNKKLTFEYIDKIPDPKRKIHVKTLISEILIKTKSE